jgi:hypothetical protein
MTVNIPPQAIDHFWEEPPQGSYEFWAFRFKPKCKIGDLIIFNFNKKVVATATVLSIQAPDQSECEQTGRFKSRWKVFWHPESFKKL